MQEAATMLKGKAFRGTKETEVSLVHQVRTLNKSSISLSSFRGLGGQSPNFCLRRRGWFQRYNNYWFSVQKLKMKGPLILDGVDNRINAALDLNSKI